MDKEDVMYIYTHTMDYCFFFEKKEIMQYATTWMNLKSIFLCEISQSQKDKYCMI